MVKTGMDFFHLIVLSLVQGLTEFLPVSSSGHLVVAPYVMGWKDQGILIDVALHVGTLLAILIYYRRDVFAIVLATFHWNTTSDKFSRNLGLYIVLATIPAGLMGLAVEHFFPDGIRNILWIALASVFFGLLMGWADGQGGHEKDIRAMTLKGAMVIGLAQMLALFPGGSRSGITMTAARFMGFNRVDAARFSFLLGIPAIAAAGLFSMIEIFQADTPGILRDAAIAIVLAFFAGLLAIHFMMTWLKKFGLMPFVIYRLVFAGLLLFFIEGV